MRLMNPELFHQLLRKFGEVKVSNPGVPFKCRVIFVDGKERLDVLDFGETYRINCPYCYEKVGRPDTRFRLWISHRWGTIVPPFPKRQWRLIKCFNEDCFNDRNVLEDFRNMFLYENFEYTQPVILDEEPQEVTLPKGIVNIDQLPGDHPANAYLRSRGFDPKLIADHYKAYYIGDPDPDIPYLYHSLLFPIYMDSKLVSWQARALGDRLTKYISAKGSRVHHYLYGWDFIPKDLDTCILVEGIFDVFRIGPPALGLFGCDISPMQTERIASRFKRVFILFDGDRAGKEHAPKVANKLKNSGVETVKVISLPGGDPDSLTEKQVVVIRKFCGV